MAKTYTFERLVGIVVTDDEPALGHSLSAAGSPFGATSRIRAVCHGCVPYHNAIELAKDYSPLDYCRAGAR